MIRARVEFHFLVTAASEAITQQQSGHENGRSASNQTNHVRTGSSAAATLPPPPTTTTVGRRERRLPSADAISGRRNGAGKVLDSRRRAELCGCAQLVFISCAAARRPRVHRFYWSPAGIDHRYYAPPPQGVLVTSTSLCFIAPRFDGNECDAFGFDLPEKKNYPIQPYRCYWLLAKIDHRYCTPHQGLIVCLDLRIFHCIWMPLG